jgi:hypothetical protein
MSIKHLIFGLFFLFFGLPIVVSLVVMAGGAGMAAYTMYSVFHMVGSETAVPRKAGWNVVNLQNGGGTSDGYKLIVERQNLLDGRVVKIGASMALDDLLNVIPGSNPSGPGAAESAGPHLAKRECDVLLQTIAEKCVVKSVDIDRRSQDSRIYNVRMTLMFVEKESFGKVETDKELSFIQSTVQFNLQGSSTVRIDRRGQPSLRQDFYREAAAICRRNRTTSGNCAIQSIDISTRPDATGNMVNVSGRVRVGMLQAQAASTQAAHRAP